MLHSGPLTNFGSGIKDFIHPQDNYFTDGCHAINSEINHQFSTVEFTFPTQQMETEGMQPCIKLKSYAERADNVIFERTLCGEIMREGTAEQDVCTLPRLTFRTEIIYIFSLCIIGVNLFVALSVLGFKRCLLAISYFGVGLIFFCVTLLSAILGAFCFGTLGVNMFAVSIFALIQSIIESIFICMALYHHKSCLCEERETDSVSRNRDKTLNNQHNTADKSFLEKHTIDIDDNDKAIIEVSYDSAYDHTFEVGEWKETNSEEHTFEVGVWEE